MATSQPSHQWHHVDGQKNASRDSSSKQPFSSEFDEFVLAIMKDYPTPGISLATIRGTESWSKAYGYSDHSKEQPATPDTLYWTASTTKSFLCAAVAHVVESQEPSFVDVNWSTKLVDLIGSDFVLQDELATNRTTFVDALSHRTGLPRHDLVWINGTNNVKDQTRALRHLPLHNDFRTIWEYNNMMYSATSHALETVTSKKTGQLLHDWLWEPLGMESTFYSLSDAEEYTESHDGSQIALGYLYDESNETFEMIPFSAIPQANGAGGMISSVTDYTKWMYAMMHPSDARPPNPSSNPITKATVSALTAKNMVVPEDPKYRRPYDSPLIYGLGLQTTTYRGQKLFEHNGGLAGYMTKMVWLPDLEWGVIVMQNAYSMAYEIIGWRLIDDFLDNQLSNPDPNLSGQIKTGRHDMANFSHNFNRDKTAALEDAAIRKRLYPALSPHTAPVPPSLPLRAYEGTYTHPAYGAITISPSSTPNSQTPAPPSLALHLTAPRSLQVTVTLHHVSGEFWYAYLRSGPGCCLVDDAGRAVFTIGVDGEVQTLSWQVESALEKGLEFEREGAKQSGER
ncbi:hypothetical protein MBLNU230_g2575t1 [Neophaeotheca triangularis]